MNKLSARSRTYIRTQLNELFDQSDLDGICYEIGIDNENLPRKTKDELIRSLIRFLERTDNLVPFLHRVAELRPKEDWHVEYDDFEETRPSQALSPKRVASLTNQDTPEDACFEFLRMVNLHAPWEMLNVSFGKAVAMTDEAGERIGWLAIPINEESIGRFNELLKQFAKESVRIEKDCRLHRNYLAAIAVGDTLTSTEVIVDTMKQVCEAMIPRLGVFVQIGRMVNRRYVDDVITGA